MDNGGYIKNSSASLFEEDKGKANSLYAEIVIPLALPQNYTWRIPEEWTSQIQAGIRVEVELRNKRYAGLVKRVFPEKPAAFDPKDILNIIDTAPVLQEKQFRLWEWIAKYYMCSEGEVMSAALPAHFKLSSETILVFNEEVGDDFSLLDTDEFLVAEALLLRKELKLSEVQQILDKSQVYPVVKRLIDKSICFVWESLKDTYVPKKESYVLLDPTYLDELKLAQLINEWSRAPKQLDLLLAFLHLQKTEGEVIKSALLKKSGASDAQLKGLSEKNILRIEKRQVDRLRTLPREMAIDFHLSEAQEEALTSIRHSFEKSNVCLLHGVTGSGKTQLYIHLIEQQIRKGKQVLYLLPEIALTAQIIRRLQKHFGGYIGIYHSKFSQNERVEIWNKVRTGELQVVLGARSALFLPFADLGLIICDEEHDSSYKQQQPAPRYHARDAGIFYASLFGAKVLLGSGTPSLESYFNAVAEKYSLVTLSERYGSGILPSIELVDTRMLNRQQKEKVMVSPLLKEKIEGTISNNRQVILFQNRRGYVPQHICRSCGWIPHCRHCDVSLTYHKFKNKLQCHYCGTIYSVMLTCEACGSHDFVKHSFGTEKVEEYLNELFPEARIARMDHDTVSGKTAHDELIQKLETHKVDLLVGTQMVVKGLDFEKVDLVGILDADSILNFADFRVNERAFQLMEQVSGRAGRKDANGKVIIQVAQVHHPVLQFVMKHDYAAFYTFEMEGRKQFLYPPFSRIIHLTFRHRNRETVTEAATFFAGKMKEKFSSFMVGPAEPVVNRIRNQFIMELMFKIPRDAAMVRRCKELIRFNEAYMHQQDQFKSVVLTADVDPL